MNSDTPIGLRPQYPKLADDVSAHGVAHVHWPARWRRLLFEHRLIICAAALWTFGVLVPGGGLVGPNEPTALDRHDPGRWQALGGPSCKLRQPPCSRIKRTLCQRQSTNADRLAHSQAPTRRKHIRARAAAVPSPRTFPGPRCPARTPGSRASAWRGGRAFSGG